MSGVKLCEIQKKCPCCDKYKRSIERRRLNTSYVDDESNFLTSCLHCYADAFEDYAERWADYYSGCM